MSRNIYFLIFSTILCNIFPCNASQSDEDDPNPTHTLAPKDKEELDDSGEKLSDAEKTPNLYAHINEEELKRYIHGLRALKANKLDEAQAYFEAINTPEDGLESHNYNDNFNAYYYLGIIHRAKGANNKAEEYFLRAAQGNHAQALHELSVIRKEQGNDQEAYFYSVEHTINSCFKLDDAYSFNGVIHPNKFFFYGPFFNLYHKSIHNVENIEILLLEGKTSDLKIIFNLLHEEDEKEKAKELLIKYKDKLDASTFSYLLYKLSRSGTFGTIWSGTFGTIWDIRTEAAKYGYPEAFVDLLQLNAELLERATQDIHYAERSFMSLNLLGRRGFHETYRVMAEHLYREKDKNIRIIKKLLKVADLENSIKASKLLAEIYFQEKKREKSIKLFKEISESEYTWDQIDAYISLATIAEQANNQEEAIQYLNQAAELGSGLACLKLGAMAMDNLEFEKAGEYYLKGIEDPNYNQGTICILNYANTLILLSKELEFIDFFENGPGKAHEHAKYYAIFMRHKLNIGDNLSEEIKTLEAFLIDSKPSDRDIFISNICAYFSEDLPQVQHYLQLIAGLNDEENPNGFIAVHRGMIKKSQEPCIHNLVKTQNNLVVNLEKMKPINRARGIHMPLNAWHALFDQVEALPEEAKMDLAHKLGIPSLQVLMGLRNEFILTNLLDPQDSTQARKDISEYSHKLRTVLHSIKTQNNLDAFLQLLINVTTCKMGKLNGIMHSYLLLQDIVLPESSLGEAAFKQDFDAIIQERFLRTRDSAILQTVSKITSQKDSHDIIYITGIIGRDIGVYGQDELIAVDINANIVSTELREKSKQQLLDMFYEFFTPETLIEALHPLFSSTSQDPEAEKSTQQTLRNLINIYLQDDAMDNDGFGYNPEMIVLNAQNKPIGLHKAATIKLLEILGYLRS
ncbi:MAG: hypothetical protein KBB83_02595 [Alphaproteobacteria bacterium]|nr:hypothetical protein [Alphaproteobacteria bacterium]